MTVKEAIEQLKKYNQEAILRIEFDGPDGCDTCGYGGETTRDVVKIIDLEASVVFSEL